jgi:hypothetical protein
MPKEQNKVYKKTCIRKVGKLKRRRRFNGMGEAQPIPIDLFQF